MKITPGLYSSSETVLYVLCGLYTAYFSCGTFFCSLRLTFARDYRYDSHFHEWIIIIKYKMTVSWS